MVRMAYDITEENRRRLELMKAFGVIEGREVTLQLLVNMAIEKLFISFYSNYSESNNGILKEAVEEMVPKRND